MSKESKFIDTAETILVSGATGTVGSEVVRQLSSTTDINIKAAARFVDKIKNLEGDKVKAVPVDYNKPESLKEALKNVDKLFLLIPDVPNAHELASNLVNEAKKAEVIHIVKQSIMGMIDGFTNFHSRSIKSNNAFYLPMKDTRVCR